MTRNGHPVDTTRNDRVLTEVTESVASTEGAPLVAVTGPLGVGRSTLLSQLEAALTGRGIRTVTLRLSPNPVAAPLHATLRSVGRTTEENFPATAWASAGSLPGVQAVTTPEQTASAIAKPLVAEGDVTLLVDDAHWIDSATLNVLEHLVDRLAGTTVHLVCALRVPVSPALAGTAGPVFRRLWHSSLVRHVRLRPLGMPDVAALAGAAFEARPDQELVSSLSRLSAGVPAVLLPLIQRYAETDSIRVVDGYAHLVRRHREVTLPDHNPLVMNVRSLGKPAWETAKALSVMWPLGDSVPRLLGEVLDSSPDTILRILLELQEAAVLRRDHAGRGWRFRVPLLAPALAASLGPYERRHLAKRAITALWQEQAHCDDQDFPADQLAIAGRFVDPERARTQLLTHATSAAPMEGRYNSLWLRSAATLPTSRREQARTLLAQATMSLRHGDHRQALLCADAVRHQFDEQLTGDERAELDRAHVLALHGAGEIAGIEHIADTPDDRRLIGRATALLLLGRWRECGALLTANRDRWTNTPLAAYFGHFLEAQTHFVAGRTDHVPRCLADARRWLPESSGPHHLDLRGLEVLTTTAGAAADVPSDDAPPAVLAIRAAHDGRFDEAMALARRTIAGGTVHSHDPAFTFLHRSAAMIQLSRGKLSRGRELLHAAREAAPPLPHLLDSAEAQIDKALGQPDEARAHVRRGLDYAAARELVIGTDRLWAQLAELELARGDAEAARACVAELDQVASATGTAAARLSCALAASLVGEDRRDAQQTIRLARDCPQPFEFATVIMKLVAHGLGDPAVLPEAYEILGNLGALLPRAWLRNLMQQNGLSVPGRQQTVAENERLLATLVADGLGNRQIATVLRTSERSVDNRLARLYSRTGFQSRVELAMSVITGSYETTTAVS